METIWITTCVIMIICGLLGLIAALMRISDQAKKSLLEEMYKNGDISSSAYRYYLEEL